MGAFARLSMPRVEEVFADLDTGTVFHVLRPAEQGLVMVRARAGGTGQQYNTGEMTATRCSVRAESGSVGHGYVAGRNRRHAEIAAKLDALMQDADPVAVDTLIDRLEAEINDAARARQQKSAPTRVEFFTLVRGENE